MNHIMRCPKCSKFTMRAVCECNAKTISVKPQRYSPGKFAEYRRKAKLEELKSRNLL